MRVGVGERISVVKGCQTHVPRFNLFITVREWAKTLVEVMNQAIKMVWEQLGRLVRDRYQPVNSVLMIDANMSPSDIRLDHANESKVIFLATGSQPLQHKKKLQLCQEMENLARELYSYLPVLAGLGLSSMLKKVTDEETELYDGLLRTDRDDREAQVIRNFDRVHELLDEAIDEHGLVRPLHFRKIPIDRTSLTFYNQREVSDESTSSCSSFCHTRLHLGFSVKLRIWQVPACKMEP